MRKIFTLIILLAGFAATAQQYNNEWIRFTQPYYKFKVGKTGIYRIPKTVLDAAGIGNTQVQFFELWRNGKKVPFYPTVPSGTLPGGGYLEFWGQANDGEPDRPIYRDPASQHHTKYSFFSDTAIYFLSINTDQSGFRVNDVVNNVAGNVLPAEPYFIHTAGFYPHDRKNHGFAAIVGEYVYSSAYDKGEVWSSGELSPASTYVPTLTNLLVYTGGPDATLNFGASGNALNPRTVKIRVNGTEVKDTLMDYFNDINTSAPIPLSLIGSNSAAVQFINTSPVSSDRMVATYLELVYPRQFDFANLANFEFTLPAKPAGYFLQISNFSYGSVQPVLYDLASGERFVGDLSVPGKVQFALPGNSVARRLVLVSMNPANINTVGTLTTKNFINYTNAAYEGDFVIIANSRLYTGSAGNNPVNDYKAYRESVAGGNHKVVIIDIDELIDQFAFGIKKHPLSVKNFLRYARNIFPIPIKHVFLIGRGMTDYDYYPQQSDPVDDQLNLVPTFGYPASDNMLSSADATSPVPVTPIGRLSVVTGREIEDYLEKVKQYENTQKNAPNTLAGRDWMKNIIHVTGSSDPYLGTVLCNYMGVYKQIIEDTLFGGKVTTFCKTSTNPVELLGTQRLTELFAEGVSMLTYFGHSSATTLEFNLDNPQAYNNPGKYPVFYVNGCNAGNFFTFNPQRLVVNETLSEKYVLAKQRGSIAFIASTHYGIVNYLNLFLTNLYGEISQKDFHKSLGEIQKDALGAMIDATGSFDYYSRMHAEQITLHGDPSLVLNTQLKPDYVMEESLIKLDKDFISVAENFYKVGIKPINLGKAYDDSIMLEVKQQYPDGTVATIYRQKMKGIRYADSVTINVPIVSTRDKGENRLTITIDADNNVDEMAENNNTATKKFVIFEDEARPSYPFNYAIINNATQKLYASTANPFNAAKTYVMEIDTTALYNSPLKVSRNISAPGGIIEFDPGISYIDSTVYYWRISPVPVAGQSYLWNTSSFLYKNSTVDGFNQSHYYQHQESDLQRISLDQSGKWKYGLRTNEIFMRNGIYPIAASQAGDFGISVNGSSNITSVCGVSGLIFNVFDSVTLQPWFNAAPGQQGQYGSNVVCANDRRFNFQFNVLDTNKRRKMVEFMDLIPDGDYVVVKNISDTFAWTNTYASTWMGDTSFLGSNNSVYHRLLQQGFITIDSFNRPRAFLFIYQKNRQNQFTPKYILSQGYSDRIALSIQCSTPDTLGFIKSPKFGPAKKWREVIWRGESMEPNSDDNPTVDVIGIDNNNLETNLYTLDRNTQNFDVSAVDPLQYPYLQLRMRNIDSVKLTPYQLKYWQIHYDPVPEGALAANVFFTSQDTVDVGETVNFAIAFKNISKTPFDSIAVKAIVLDQSNVPHSIIMPKQKPIVSGDTITVRLNIDTKDYPGHNVLNVDVNPDFAQPEQYHFNNILYRNLYVRVDKTSPLLDVTFDGMHILNRDIVSAKPHIQIKLKDEARYLLLNDTSLVSVQLRYPNGTIKTFNFDNDTLRFIPATSGGTNNTATIDFNPQFLKQFYPEGDDYELTVKAKDKSNNRAGESEFRVAFRVIIKPMISNLFNYPNPFSTSTAFVFVLTGSEIPQNLKIQILTVTGKIVREITINELGPLHIGRNITDFKWDGTDQFGQKLANGVYLYRVVTSMNGKSLEKYKSGDDNTDRFFNNGYGKMYLMR